MRSPHRVPAVYLLVHFVAIFLYWVQGRASESYDPPLPLPTDFIGFHDPTIGMNLAGALLASFVLALIPAIGALAGLALAPANRAPPWSRTIFSAFVSAVPSVAYAVVLSMLRGHVRWAHDVGTEGALFEFALIGLAGVWVITPVIVSRRLFRKHAQFSEPTRGGEP
jgi:hypothetical protein